MPIIKQKKIAGIMKYYLRTYTWVNSHREGEIDYEDERADYGARIFWIDDIKKIDTETLGYFRGFYGRDIVIETSLPLLDKHDIFRYTIQNAFDGDPATSYVEDTEDDLIVLNFPITEIKAFSIINGYARNEDLYYANNRVKELADETVSPVTNASTFIPNKKFVLKDRVLTPQIIINNFSGTHIFITGIYKGSKYNDTCIAEINIKTKDGWLFGDEP
jgi:hypothetical protein